MQCEASQVHLLLHMEKTSKFSQQNPHFKEMKKLNNAKTSYKK